ncbi:MAG: DUF5060 domain-containing protein [Akkermansiaceae bacterium]
MKLHLILSTLFPLAAFAVHPHLIFEEKDGIVAVEAELFQSQTKNEIRSWHLVSNTSTPEIKPDGDPSHAATASAGAYLEILPDTRRTHGDKLIQKENFINTPGEMAVLTYHVKFNTPGRYYCWVRTHSTGTEDNGLHLGINGTWPESGARMQWITKNKWHWNNKQRTEKVHIGIFGKIWIDVPTAGLHKVHFSMREDGFEFDKFVLTLAKPDEKKPITDFGPAVRLISGNSPRPSFPKSWGEIPRHQTRDRVTLPGGYGMGSSTLKKWISANLEKSLAAEAKAAADKKAAWQARPKKPKPTAEPSGITQPVFQTLELQAAQFPLNSGYYIDQGKWLAINPDKHKTAKSTIAFPYPSGKYHLTLLAVGENDGQCTYEVTLNGKTILKHKAPLAKETFEEGPQYHKTVTGILLGAGEDLTVSSTIASADGKEYSRARLSGLRFVPADADTAKKVAGLKSKPSKKAAIPKLSAEELKPLQHPRQPDGDGTVTLTVNIQWQPLTLTLDGPFAHELDNTPNPFRDYAFTVTFRHESGAPIYHIPGYFAADGNAAETSAKAGTKWRAHLSPDKPGNWHYQTHFHTGKDVALHPVEKAPETELKALEKYDTSGTFKITAASKDSPGFYSQGRLEYQNSNYLQFAGSGRPFLKVGADAPETLLAYADFDDTVAPKKNAPIKHYKAHLRDWKEGDPTWKGGKGKGLIGALNYLSGKGMNAFSFLPYNAGGDGDNIWPFVSRNNKFHYDCSKLDQWNIVFTHGQAKGLFLHFKLQETEIDDNRRGHKKTNNGNVPTSLDGGKLGPERKLYCREIVARFGHHLALNWNIGEENTQSTEEQMDMANYLRAVDPYDHHLVIHTYPDQQDKIYPALQGKHSPYTGASLQNSSLKQCHWQVVKWVRSSKKKGKAWGVAFDEPGNASEGMPADPGYPGMPSVKDGYKGDTVDDCRKYTLWGTLMAGGWGVEYYFGYKLPQNDLVCEDWRSRDLSWTYGKYALDFFNDNNIPVHQMKPMDELVGNKKHDNSAYCLAKKGLYLVFLPNGGTKKLELLDNDGVQTIWWYNPRNGEQTAKAKLVGDGSVTLSAPDQNDWLAIIE